MRYALLTLALLTFLCTCDRAPDPRPPAPLPTELGPGGAEAGERREAAREAYEARLHAAGPATDWRALEARNALARHEKRKAGPRQKDVETFADGLILGEWFERGSKFTAGSVHDVVQHPNEPNRLFVISDGGSIWEMDYAAETFELINHDIQLASRYLTLVPTPAGVSLLAFAGRQPMYSTDEGRSWEAATVRADGITVPERDLSVAFSPTVDDSVAYCVLRFEDNRLDVFRSADGGQTYDRIPLPDAPAGFGLTHLHHAPGTGRTYVVMKRMYTDPEIRLYEMLDDAGTVTYAELGGAAVGTENFFRARVGASPRVGTDSLRVYLQADVQLFRSDDDGLTFREMPELEVRPWSNQPVYVRPSDPDFVAYGAVELFVSRDGGETFAKANEWWEYYQDTDRFLHADIMNLTEITDAAGEPRVLVSSHGGLNRLNEDDERWYNVARAGLNVAQYYDVRTNPVDRSQIYAGSQDQGFQVLPQPQAGDRTILGGYQEISGDYGHMELTADGEMIFINYPFGSIYVYDDLLRPGGPSYLNNTSIDSENEFIWITPMMAPPGGVAQTYVAGGSAAGGLGSYLIEVTVDRNVLGGTYGEITLENLPFDFRDAAGANLSALGYSPLNADRFYAATENGRFYTSVDRGESWEETLNFVPDGWYLYGQAIHASRTDEQTVWLGGSGYNNPAVFRSTDGGQNFFPASEGLPPTTVIGLASNAAETLLFAATEAGPFVYVMADERWYDLSGQFAPTQRYTSVEFIEEENLARFGTYGRGVWDFQVEEVVSTEGPRAGGPDFAVYPNPARGRATVAGPAPAYRMYDAMGRETLRATARGGQTTLDLTGVAAGVYFVQPLDDAGRVAGLGRRLVVD